MAVLALPISPADVGAALARIATKIEFDESGCWLWTGTIVPSGYGQIWLVDRMVRAHRALYVYFNARDLPPELQLDHLCRRRSCVNPSHLEPVTNRENTLRGKLSWRLICVRGHLRQEPNLILKRRGERVCRACHRAFHAADRRNLTGPDRESFIQAYADRKYAEIMQAVSA